MYKKHQPYTYLLPMFILKLGSKKPLDKTLLKYHEPVRLLRKRTVLKRAHHGFQAFRIMRKRVMREPNVIPKKALFRFIQSSKLVIWFNKLSKKTKIQWMAFFVLSSLALISISYMTLRFMDNQYEYNIFSYANIEAILPGQEIPGSVSTGVVLLRELDLDELEVGDQVVICCDFGQLDTYWVEDVIVIDRTNERIEVTYDFVFTNIVEPDEIYGVYVHTSGFLGTLYYSATFLRGYLLLLATHLIVVYGFFYIVLKKRKDRIFGR